MRRTWISKLLAARVSSPIRRPRPAPQFDVLSLEDRLVPTVFTNPAAIAIPDDATTFTSTINVSGLAGVAKTVAVSLNGFSHTQTQEIDILLVSPTGKAVKILSDTGGSGNAVSLIDLTFDDSAADALGASAYSTGGTFKPSDVNDGVDTWTGYAGTPGTGLNSTFRNTSANGTWTLFIRDEAPGDTGGFAGGWLLDIFSRANTAPTGVADSFTTAEDGGLLSVTRRSACCRAAARTPTRKATP